MPNVHENFLISGILVLFAVLTWFRESLQKGVVVKMQKLTLTYKNKYNNIFRKWKGG